MESFSIFRSISSLQILIKSPKIEKYAQIIFFFLRKLVFVGKLASSLRKSKKMT
jgi:hypothetical protein